MARNIPEVGAIINEHQKRRHEMLSLIDSQFFAKFALRFGISDDKTEAARERACSAAGIYQIVKRLQAEPDGQPGFPAVKKEVLMIERQAGELAKSLSGLSESAIGWLHSAEEIVDQEITRNWDTISESRFGHVIYRQPAEIGVGPTITYLNFWQIKQAVSVLANMAGFVAQNARPLDQGGRPHNEALFLWVINVQGIWKDYVGTPFTLDQHQGNPVSEAARFCEELMQAVDPGVTFPQLATAMRKAIGSAKPGRGRRRR